MNSTAQIPILPGFADPVHDAQTCFRAVLDGMSRPGNTVTLALLPPVIHLNAALPASCLAGMVAIALTLCDAGTPVWLDARLDTPAMRQHLRFHCGCPIVSDPGRAGFAFIGDPKTMPRFECFSSGEPAYPDRSATLILAADFAAAAPYCLLSGPGIPRAGHPQGELFGLAGLPARFWEDRTRTRTEYPLGVDFLFVDTSRTQGGAVRIACLPRTTSAVPVNGTPPLPAKEHKACMSR
jgi:alpha-D-ribose 1-methylphosphonate 5-triphosphate synthase subunit PhnH